jgi:drug/metabolite transporter (DMT)-like permease
MFSFLYLGQRVTPVQVIGFVLIAGGAFLVFHGGLARGA